MFGYKLRKTPKLTPRFAYGDKVKVINGFYRGFEGVITDYLTRDHYYYVATKNGTRCIEESHLEAI